MYLAAIFIAAAGSAALAQDRYAFDQPGDRPFMTNTNVLERFSPDGSNNNRSYKLVVDRPTAEAMFTREPIAVDGIREGAWDVTTLYLWGTEFDSEMSAPTRFTRTYGTLQMLWDGPVLYVLVQVMGDDTRSDSGVPDWNRASFSPESDGLFVFMDVFNDRWGMETDTQGVFLLSANPELDAVTSFNNSFIPSLGSFFNPDNQDYSNRLLAFASSGYLEGDVNYVYEFALQIGGWGDAWQRELTNGTEIGLDVAIYNQGQFFTWFGKRDFFAGREGNSNLPNSERVRNRDWGVVTLTGWDGITPHADSSWCANEAIRFWSSDSNPGSGDASEVWTADSKSRFIDARTAYLTLPPAAEPATKQRAVREVCAAFAALRWADRRFPDPAELPVNHTLPNLWQFFDANKGTNGMVTDAEEWEQRRQELLELAQFYEYGYKPRLGDDYTLELISINYDGGDRAAITATVAPTNARYTGGEARDITIEITLPATTADGGPAPIAFGGNFIDAGLASIRFPGWARDERTDAGAWGNPNRNGLFYELFPYQRNSTSADSSILIGNATAVSIHLDVLALAVADNPALAARIDPTLAVTKGFSIGGKNAFVAAVFDERVKVVIAGGAGATGPANWRYNAQGQEYNFSDTPFYNPGAEQIVAHGTEGPGNSYRHNRVRETELFRHFMPYGHMYAHEEGAYNYGGYSRLPFDQALLVATLAPARAIVINTNINDYNNGAMTDNMSLQVAKSAWRVLGTNPDEFVRFNSGNYVSERDPHGSAGSELEAKYLQKFFFGIDALTEAETERLNTDPYALPVANGRTQSPYDYYWGGMNTITGGVNGITGSDGWYFYSFQ